MPKKRTASKQSPALFGGKADLASYYKRLGVKPNPQMASYLSSSGMDSKKGNKPPALPHPKSSPHAKALERLRAKPELIKGNHEHYSQVRIFDHFERANPELYSMLYAVPNAGKRGFKASADAQAEGLRAGVLDMGLDCPRGRYHFARFELKSEKGTISDNQKIWGSVGEKAGAFTAMVVGHEAAIEVIQAYWDLGEFDPGCPPLISDRYSTPWR